MESKASCESLPPGFRFHPTDEELIVYYLKNQATSKPCPVSIIPEVDIYKFDPWQLPDKAEFGEAEWYFFSPRDRKYPNGVRPNRATVSGYWKATGTDKAIYSGSKYVGVKKSLVFYKGKPPKGVKTDWIMHEYRLTDSRTKQAQLGSMRLDDWVLCRIYKKRNVAKVVEPKVEEYLLSPPQIVDYETNVYNNNNNGGEQQKEQEQERLKFPRTFSLATLLDMDYLGPISNMLNDNNPFGPAHDFLSNAVQKVEFAEMPYQLAHQAQTSNLSQQHVFVNQGYDFAYGLDR